MVENHNPRAIIYYIRVFRKSS